MKGASSDYDAALTLLKGEREERRIQGGRLGLQHSFKKDSTRLLEIFEPNPRPLEQACLSARGMLSHCLAQSSGSMTLVWPIP